MNFARHTRSRPCHPEPGLQRHGSDGRQPSRDLLQSPAPVHLTDVRTPPAPVWTSSCSACPAAAPAHQACARRDEHFVAQTAAVRDVDVAGAAPMEARGSAPRGSPAELPRTAPHEAPQIASLCGGAGAQRPVLDAAPTTTTGNRPGAPALRSAQSPPRRASSTVRSMAGLARWHRRRPMGAAGARLPSAQRNDVPAQMATTASAARRIFGRPQLPTQHG